MKRLITASCVLTMLISATGACSSSNSNQQEFDAIWGEDQSSLFDTVYEDLADATPDTAKPDVKKDNNPTPDEMDDTDPSDVPDWIETDIEDTYDPDVPDIQKPDDQGGPTGKTVKQIQGSPDSLTCAVPFGAMLVDVGIEIPNAVVTAPPITYQLAGNQKAFFVQDPGGGPLSGMQAVYAADQLPDLKPGATVSLFGNHREAQCTTVFVITSLTVKDFQGPEPDAFLTTTSAIASDPEQYEGVLVKLENVQVLDANPDQPNGLDNGHFLIADGLRVGNDYKVPYMTPPTDARKSGDTFNYIVGIVREEKGTWIVMPRSNVDMWLSGTTQPEDDPEIITQPDVVDDTTPDDIVIPDVDEDNSWPPDVIEDNVIPDVVEIVDVVEEVTPDVQPDTTGDIVIPPEADSPLVITEIMYDPDSVPDDKGEWVEIYNTTDQAININGFRLTGNDGNMVMISGSVWVEPGQYFIWGANSLESQNGGVTVNYDYVEVDFVLENTTDSVILRNMFGQPVDEVIYNELAGWPLAQGASIQLMHPNLDNSQAKHWKVSTTYYGNGTNRGTPGAPFDGQF